MALRKAQAKEKGCRAEGAWAAGLGEAAWLQAEFQTG